MSNQKANKNEKEKSVLSIFESAMNFCCEGGCCNMKTTPEDDITDESSKGCCCNMLEEKTKEKSPK